MADLGFQIGHTDVIQFEKTWYESALSNLNFGQLGMLFNAIKINGDLQEGIAKKGDEQILETILIDKFIKAYMDWYYKTLEEL